MEKTEIQEKVVEVVAEQLGIDQSEVTLEKNLMKDFDADSLDALETTIKLSDKFDIEIPDEDATKLQTVKQIIDYLDHRLNPPS